MERPRSLEVLSFEMQHLSESCSTRDVGVEVWNLPHWLHTFIFCTIWFECVHFDSSSVGNNRPADLLVRKAVFSTFFIHLTSCCFRVCNKHHMVTTVAQNCVHIQIFSVRWHASRTHTVLHTYHVDACSCQFEWLMFRPLSACDEGSEGFSLSQVILGG